MFETNQQISLLLIWRQALWRQLPSSALFKQLIFNFGCKIFPWREKPGKKFSLLGRKLTKLHSSIWKFCFKVCELLFFRFLFSEENKLKNVLKSTSLRILKRSPKFSFQMKELKCIFWSCLKIYLAFFKPIFGWKFNSVEFSRNSMHFFENLLQMNPLSIPHSLLLWFLQEVFLCTY